VTHDSGILANMIAALSLEVAAIQKSGGSTSFDLVGGRFIGVSDGNYIYQFQLADEIHLRDDTPVRVALRPEGHERHDRIDPRPNSCCRGARRPLAAHCSRPGAC